MKAVLTKNITLDDIDDTIKKKIEELRISEEQYLKMMNSVVNIVAAGEEDNPDEKD